MRILLCADFHVLTLLSQGHCLLSTARCCATHSSAPLPCWSTSCCPPTPSTVLLRLGAAFGACAPSPGRRCSASPSSCSAGWASAAAALPRYATSSLWMLWPCWAGSSTSLASRSAFAQASLTTGATATRSCTYWWSAPSFTCTGVCWTTCCGSTATTVPQTDPPPAAPASTQGALGHKIKGPPRGGGCLEREDEGGDTRWD